MFSELGEHFSANDELETTLSEINTEKFQSAIIKGVQDEIFILEKDDTKCQICKTRMFSSYDYIENPANFALCEDCLVLYSGRENCDSLQWAKIRKKCKKFVKSLFTKFFFEKFAI